MENSEIYVKDSGGKLTINNSKAFINMLYGGESDSDSLKVYGLLKDYGYKQKSSLASEIPASDYENIINFAIVKAIQGFKPEKQAKLQSYFWEKLRGEISSYRAKHESLHKKVISLVQEGEAQDNVEYVYQKGNGVEGDENYIEAVDLESIEEKIEKESTYERQIKAFKMAFSGIPRQLQTILLEIGKGRKIREVSLMINLSEYDISQKRNYALSLILQRIMRSHHINEEEKYEVAELHGFTYDPEMYRDTRESIKED